MALPVIKNLFDALKDWPSFFFLFLWLGFIAPSLPFWALCFYLLFIPRFLFELFQKRKTYPQIGLFFPLFALVLCFLWVGIISCFWSVLGHQNWKWGIDFTCTLLFLLGAWEAMRQTAKPLEKMSCVLALGGSLNGVIALLLHLAGGNIDHYAPDRMAGFGIFHPVVFAGDLIGLSVLVLIFLLSCRLLKNKKLQKQDFLYLFLVSFNGLFLFLTGCRMAWIALFMALLMFLKWQKQVMLLGISLLLMGSLFLNAKISHSFWERADSGHMQIWQKTWEYFSPYLLCGKGMQLKMLVPDGLGGFFAHPHSFYVALCVQGGLIGAGLFLLGCVGLFILGIRSIESRKGLAFGLYALFCGTTDLSFVFKGPSEEWLLIWLPLLMSFFAVWRESAKSQIFRSRGG